MKKGNSPMTADELFAEAQKIARPCLYLYEGMPRSGGQVAAVWGGEGIIPLDAPGHRHWLTLNCQIIPKKFDDLKLAGAISIYTDEKSCKGGRCVFDPKLTALEVGDDGEDEDDFDDEDEEGDLTLLERATLCARDGTSLPSFCQLLRNASPPILKWMQEVGCDVSKRFFQSAKTVKPMATAYNKLASVNDPIQQSDNPYYAVLGGWPIEIYEDDWAEDVKDVKARQFLFTYANSEPWVQVWVDGTGAFHVRQIIT
jgi:hypothetical protein